MDLKLIINNFTYKYFPVLYLKLLCIHILSMYFILYIVYIQYIKSYIYDKNSMNKKFKASTLPKEFCKI